MHTYYRLRLIYSFYGYSADSPLSYLLSCRFYSPPSEAYYSLLASLPITRFGSMLLVEVMGFAPMSTTTFKQLQRILFRPTTYFIRNRKPLYIIFNQKATIYLGNNVDLQPIGINSVNEMIPISRNFIIGSYRIG